MIGYVHGILLEKEAPLIILDVHGVGFEIKIPMSSFYDLPEISHPVSLYVHVIYREDAQNMFGFVRKMERDFFRELIRVNGVGPMLALTLLSGLTVEECIHCVRDENIARLVQLPGVGKRTAERLIVELKPCVERWQGKVGSSDATENHITLNTSAIGDAEAALISLGYKPVDAKKVLQQLDTQASTSEEYIRLALKQLVR